jgi:hypothetical protein
MAADSCTAIVEYLDGHMELILWNGVPKIGLEQAINM